MDVEEQQATPHGVQSISAWYDRSKPLWIDLVGDYAGEELFLIEGDSLLRECFEDKRIDFRDGFQLLHALYVVERFIQGLLTRHCNFHIAFFSENKYLCVPHGASAITRPRYLLARSVIIRHLTLRLPSVESNIRVFQFPSIDSDKYRDYLHFSPIHFVMVHDGAATAIAKELLDSGAQDVEDVDILSRRLLRGLIWSFNIHRLNVALINRIELRDSKVFTMIVENFTPPISLRLQMISSFSEEIRATRALLEEAFQGKPDVQESEESPLTPLNSDGSLNQAPYLATLSIASLLKEGGCTITFASAFILHTLLLEKVSLEDRRLPLVKFEEGLEGEIDRFLAKFAENASRIIASTAWQDYSEDLTENATDQSGLIDLVDGRLFRVVLKSMSDGKLTDGALSLLGDDWAIVSRITKQIANVELSLTSSDSLVSSFPSSEEDSNGVAEKGQDLSVLPFSNRIFDEHLDCIDVSTDDSVAARLGAMRIYRETTHWHSHRKPLNPKLAPVPKVTKWKNPLRLNQFYMSEMTSYAASLTGAKGKALEPETITVGTKHLTKVADEKPSKPEKVEKKSSKPEKVEKKSKKDAVPEAKVAAGAKKGTKKAAGGLSKKDQMIADNLAKKGTTESDKTFSAWVNVMKGLDAVPDIQDRYGRATSYLNNLDSTKASYLEAEINIYIIQSLLTWWSEYCKANKQVEGYHVVALIWTTVRSICTSKSPISKEIIIHVTKVCKILGITDALSTLTASDNEKKMAFAFTYPSNSQNLSIGLPQKEFQLNYCGPYMDRMLDAKPDPRVSSFVPDGWQRDVLDQLDAKRSVFVVAPTSAGKTFISFYAMEQILRADNDGVLIYVAPTKALVNQIAAEVQGRFSKKYPQPGKGVWAIHTRDYRVNNSTGCQILVTVPHILQIMLLSPANAKGWAPRVRRIIFDEVHSIGQAEDGVVWEQLLLLSPCPIIALSATVGNPESFSDWLTETQKSSGSELKMIKHSTRYSDLRKYMYEPPKTFKFSGFGKSFGVGLGLDGLEGFQPLHPIASLVDKSRGMPDDLALEPRDCFSLWKAMSKHQTEEYKVPEALNPAKSLPACIRKADIFAWEKALKVLLQQWMRDNKSPFDKVVAELTPPAPTESRAEPINSASSANSTSSSNSSIASLHTIDPSNLEATTLPLLFQLHKRRALPAILFNYDRSGCEQAAQSILTQLVDAENKWKKGPQWRKLMDGYEKHQEAKSKKSKKPPKPSKKNKEDDDDEGGSKADRQREEASEGFSSFDSFDPNAPQADFSFANPKFLTNSELEDYVKQLRRKYIKEELIDLLKRGIGVHHAGMNRKYRQSVEMLFRKGFLRVVIATGTLSLGINMPCATVVFSGDSVFLTALNFRQAAGRSGRRGFDLLGNVVFQGISQDRASRLLSSRLPEITGHFPITTSLVLRLFSLLNDSKDSPYAIKAINSLLSQPRLYLGGQSFKEQVLHHLRFSIEYLRRNQLLGPRGEPVNFTSIVSHLYFTENSSFAFHALLKGGYFHRLCADHETKTEETLRTMVLVLSHLFARRVVREVEDKEQAEIIHSSPSMVYLPDMPAEAASILRKHNDDTLEIFTTYVKTFAAQHIKEKENHLPFTKTSIGAPSTTKSEDGQPINGSAHKSGTDLSFLPSLPTPSARSSFVALSGHGDDFVSIEDLCSSTREGVHLEAAVVPHLEIHPDETRSPLNAYLLDFFLHGSVKPLEDANGIRSSDVWFALNDFSLVLATICTSLALYLGIGSNEDPEMLDVMGSGDAAENDADEQIAEKEIPATTAAEPAAVQRAIPKKGKKGVVDDWNAGEDALVAEEDFLKNDKVEEGRGETDDEEYEKLMNVYQAFRKLKTEFDEKFFKIWA